MSRAAEQRKSVGPGRGEAAAEPAPGYNVNTHHIYDYRVVEEETTQHIFFDYAVVVI